jgi:FAD/FMN-containing dehydrogenase
MDLIDQLRAALGDGAVLEGEAVSARSSGWGRREPNQARAVVRPSSTAEVATVLRLCHQHDQPVVVQAGMTGLVSGAAATADEIALSLERLVAIEEVDADTRSITVQAGAILETIQQRADEEGFLFALDLGARGSCTIGGNVATNAGGNHVIRYGMARAQVLGLEAVLADGTIVSDLTKMLKNNAGYDFKQLFIGSEGTLGVITRLVLRLRPKPKSECTALVALESFAAVSALLRSAEHNLGSDLTAFEVMWAPFYRTVTTPPAKSQPPLSHEHPFYVLVEALGTRPQADEEHFEAWLGACVESELIVDAVLAKSRAERVALWSMRDDVEQLRRYAPLFTFDVSLPIGAMEAYTVGVEAALRARWSDPVCIVFGHLGDGNLHLNIAVGDGSAETKRQVEAIVYGPLAAVAGSVSAEHGIGMEKRAYLSWSRGEHEIALMRSIKQALDPKGILGRGRVLGES